MIWYVSQSRQNEFEMNYSTNLQKNIRTFRLVIEVNKEDSVFTYFTLEACDGLCFYSTLDYETGSPFREIEIMGSADFYDEVKRTLGKLSEKYPITFLIDEKENEL